MNDGKVFSVHYNLKKSNAEGEMIESTFNREPLVFLAGIGQMLPDFEAEIIKLNEGDKFAFGITSDKAYGPTSKEAVIDLDRTIFENEGKLVDEVKVDNIVPLKDQNDNTVPARIVKIGDAKITVDVNHPLAGQDLHFSGEVVNIREASEDELAHRHVH